MTNIANAYCSFCSDIKRFKSDLNTVERKIQLLRRNNFEKAPNERLYFELKRDLQFDKLYPHFMCGRCLKADTNRLSFFENELNTLLVNAAYVIDSKNKQYHEIFQLLRGDYLGKYRVMEEFFAKKFRKDTKK